VSGDLSAGALKTGAATSDLDLTAANVELGRGARVVDTNLLDAEQVLAGSNAVGDRDIVCRCGVSEIYSSLSR
jgi:hypothetical protein